MGGTADPNAQIATLDADGNTPPVEFEPNKTAVLTYSPNGGSGNEQSFYESGDPETNVAFTVKDVVDLGFAAPEGQTFDRWSTSPDGSDSYSATGKIDVPVGGNKTLYAQWVPTSTTPVWSGLTISVTPSTSTADIGQSFTYTVEVTNKTGVDLKSLSVYNTPPEGFSYSRDTDMNNPANIWMSGQNGDTKHLLYYGNKGTLKNGDSAFFIIKTQFPTNTTVTTAVNKAAITQITSEDGQTVTSGLPSAEATVTLKEPDWSGLTITKEVNKSMAKPGDTLTYTITVENKTGIALKEVKFTDELPTDKVALGALGNDNGNSIEPNESKSIITGTANNLANNDKATFTIEVQVLSTVNAAAVENTAKITAAKSSSGYSLTETHPNGISSNTVSTDILTNVPVSVKVLFNGLKDVSQVPTGYALVGEDSNALLKGNIALGTAVKDASGQISRTFTTTADVLLGKEYSLSFTQSGYDVTGYDCTPGSLTFTQTPTADNKAINVVITLDYTKENLYIYPSVTVRTYFKGLAELPDNFGYKLTCTSAPEEATAFLTQSPLTLTKGTENGVPYLEFSAKDVTLQAGVDQTFSFTQSGYDVPGYVCALGLSNFKFNLELPTTDVPQPIQMNITNTYTQPDWGKLTITKAADKTRAMPGSVVKYTVTVTNNTGVDLSNIIVADKLDSDLRYSDSTGDYSTGTGTWTVASLANGKSVTLTLTVKLKYALTAGTVIDNTATVTSAAAGGQTYDFSSLKLSDSVSVTVTSGKGSPRTGDESNLGLWIAVMAASLACAGAAAVIYKKRRG